MEHGWRTRICLLVLLVAGLLACGGPSSAEQLRARSAFDLDCPQSKITFHKIDDRTWGVRGCGSRATYIRSCDGPKTDLTTKCTWVLNGDSRPD